MRIKCTHHQGICDHLVCPHSEPRQERFTEEEVAEAQTALNLYPANTGFWDSAQAQDMLAIIVPLRMEPNVTAAEVRANYDALRDEIEREAAAA